MWNLVCWLVVFKPCPAGRRTRFVRILLAVVLEALMRIFSEQIWIKNRFASEIVFQLLQPDSELSCTMSVSVQCERSTICTVSPNSEL